MSRRDFNRLYRAAVLENEYMTRRNLSAWDIMALENQRILHRRFRPPFIETRVKHAIAELRQGQICE